MSKPANEPRSRYLATRGVGKKFADASPKTVRLWVKEGILPPADLCINGHKFWLEENLDAHARTRMIEGVDKRPAGQFDGKRIKRSVAAE